LGVAARIGFDLALILYHLLYIWEHRFGHHVYHLAHASPTSDFSFVIFYLPIIKLLSFKIELVGALFTKSDGSR